MTTRDLDHCAVCDGKTPPPPDGSTPVEEFRKRWGTEPDMASLTAVCEPCVSWLAKAKAAGARTMDTAIAIARRLRAGGFFAN